MKSDSFIVALFIGLIAVGIVSFDLLFQVSFAAAVLFATLGISIIFYLNIVHSFRKFGRDLKKALHSSNSSAVENWMNRVPTCPETCPLLRAGRDVCADVCIEDLPKVKKIEETTE